MNMVREAEVGREEGMWKEAEVKEEGRWVPLANQQLTMK